MKHLIAALLLSITGLAQAADVSVTIGGQIQPGVYGSITIGDARPQLYYAQPQVVYAPPRGVVYEPLYLYVPPGHRQNWRKHCYRYNACNRPVYFVQDSWYEQHREQVQVRPVIVERPVVVQQPPIVVREDRRDDRHHGHGHDHGKHRGHDRD